MSWLALALKRIAEALPATLGLALFVLASAALFAAGPRVIDAQAERSLRETVAAAGDDVRNVAFTETGRIPAAAPDPLSGIAATGDELAGRLPRSVAGLVSGRYEVIDTPRFRLPEDTGWTVRLRYQAGAADRVRLVAGRLPTGATSEVKAPELQPIGTDPQGRPVATPATFTVIEVALSAESLHAMGAELDDVIPLRSDLTDGLAGKAAWYLAVHVVGVFEVKEPAASYWFGDTTLERPHLRAVSQTVLVADATALMAADAYPTLLDATSPAQLPLRYTWRYEVDPQRLQAATAGTLLADLRRMESVFSSRNSAGAGTDQSSTTGPPSLESGLYHAVDSYAGEWRTVSGILSAGEVGVIAAALLALALVCQVVARRRTATLIAWRSRGASNGQLLVAAAVEIVLDVALPCALGVALAVALLPDRPLEPSLIGAGCVFLVAAALVATSMLGSGAGSGGSGSSGGTTGGNRAGGANASRSGGGRSGAARRRGAGARRTALEALFIGVACLAALALRQRGVVTGTGAAGSGTAAAVATAIDPVLAAVPALIGAAAALLVARLVPVPLELLASVAARRSGFVPLLALRRATRRATQRLLLMALLAIAAVWSFAAVSLAAIDRGSDAAAWQSTGASFRVQAGEGTLAGDLDLEHVTGVESVAYATTLQTNVGQTGQYVPLMALDAAEYRSVVAGGRLEGDLPAGLDSPARGPTGPDQVPIPALISAALARDAHLSAGDVFIQIVEGSPVRLRAIAVADSFPTFGSGTVFAIVARDNVAAVLPNVNLSPNQAFVRAGPGSEEAIRSRVAARMPGQGIVTSRYLILDHGRGTPQYLAVSFGLALAVVVTGLYGALAVIAALFLAGVELSREAAHLRVLGLTRRQTLAVCAIENGPSSVLVAVAGLALGIGLFAFLQPGLGLELLAGGQVAGIVLDPAALLAILGALVGLVAVAVTLQAVAESIIEPAQALRRGVD